MSGSEEKTLHFGVIRDTLDEVAETLTNLVDRQFPRSLQATAGLQPYTLVSLLVARNEYDAIRFLTADMPSDAGRKTEYGVAATPLVRTLLDLLATLIFMREDLPGRIVEYHKGGWRELKERFTLLQQEHGHDPAWQKWLEQFEVGLETLRQAWGITAAEAVEIKKLRYWPILGTILRNHLCHQAETEVFLRYLNDWIYRELSAGTHVSAAGVVTLHGLLLLQPKDERREARLLKLKSDAVFTATTLFTALCTEINSVCNFGQEARLAYLWGILKEYWSEATHLFEKRYQVMLSNSNAS